jgi:hypothetical protein
MDARRQAGRDTRRVARSASAERYEIGGIEAHVAALDWKRITADLESSGSAILQSVLSPEQCVALASSYGRDELFRNRVVMARHGFGRGEYRYFAYPLPDLVQRLRTALYPPLARVANHWHAALGLDARYPPAHSSYLSRCHRAGQRKPTPLLLRYGKGDYNCLHQDLYGEHVFPLQATFLLSAPGEEFTGGEFVLTEQRPRMQSRAEVVHLEQGDGVVFAVNERPVLGSRGHYRVKMRHGVSTVRSGNRYTLGIIFHDAQ